MVAKVQPFGLNSDKQDKKHWTKKNDK